MAKLQHVYLTAHGEWTLTPWLAEKAQIGIRATIHEDGNEPAKGAVFTIADDNGDIVQDIGSLAGTHGTLQKAWTARLGPVGSSENADGTFQVDLAEDFWAYLDSIKAWFVAGFRWTHIKIAGVTAAGLAPFGSGTYTFTTPLAGTAGGNVPLPPEVAVAVSLRAPITGRRGRGRMYLPGLVSGALTVDGTVNSSQASDMATKTKTFITNLEDVPGTEEYTPVVTVMSAGGSVGVRPSQVRVGSHFDVQRRRQHQAIEAFTTVTI